MVTEWSKTISYAHTILAKMKREQLCALPYEWMMVEVDVEKALTASLLGLIIHQLDGYLDFPFRL